jgi:hypothetical protein
MKIWNEGEKKEMRRRERKCGKKGKEENIWNKSGNWTSFYF